MGEFADIGNFIDNIESQFDYPVPEGLHPETLFRNVSNWDSLQSLIVIAGVQEEYGVTITDDEFRATQTLQELYDLVIRKKDHS
jgi:acyl carrier protein